MTYIPSISTVEEASAWLKQETKVDWPAKRIIDHAIDANITVLASVPGWSAPGEGELKLADNNGNKIAWASDGLIRVQEGVLRSLQNHGRGKLNRVPINDSADAFVDGAAPIVDVSDLRIAREDLQRLANAPGVQETPAQRRERIRNRCDQLKAEGCRNYVDRVAEEEGVSVSMIKKLKNRANSDAKQPELFAALKSFGQKTGVARR